MMVVSSASSASAASAMWTRLACGIHLAWIVAKSWWRRLLGLQASSRDHHAPAIYRIYAFNESQHPGCPGFYRELSPAYFDPATWERDAKDLTGWPRLRVEVRYMFRHRKYRMVLHDGDACQFPPYGDPATPACRLPKGVLYARLQGPLGSDVDWDVTSRVMKYQGPRGDFHASLGLHVTMHDMFPFDDHADNAERFSHLRIMDTAATLHDLPYDENPRILLTGPLSGGTHPESESLLRSPRQMPPSSGGSGSKGSVAMMSSPGCVR
jgi:hypothetical protein